MLRNLCGNGAFKNIVLVTTMWDHVSPEDGEVRERQLSNHFFKRALDFGAQMARHHNTAQSAHEIIRKIVTKPPVVLTIQWELVVFHKDIVHTTAGRAIFQDQMRQRQDGLKMIGGMEEIKMYEEMMALDYAAEKKVTIFYSCLPCLYLKGNTKRHSWGQDLIPVQLDPKWCADFMLCNHCL